MVSYYRRGYGRSSLAEAPGSIVRDANDHRDLLSVLGIERAHIVGVSYSAAVALQLAATAPTPVHTLTVIEPPPVHVANSEEFIATNSKKADRRNRTVRTRLIGDQRVLVVCSGGFFRPSRVRARLGQLVCDDASCKRTEIAGIP